MKIFVTILVAVFLLSCNATKQAAKHFNKALNKDSTYVANATRVIFPCVISGRDTITTIDTVFDFVEVECPEQVEYIKDTVEGVEIVRVVRTPVFVKAPVIKRTITNTITIRERDSAAIFVLIKEKENLYKEIDKLEKRVKIGGIITWILSGALLICLALVFFFIKRKT